MGIATGAISLQPWRGYIERSPRPSLASFVARSWVSVVREERPVVRRIIPDGSADIVWIDGILTVAGPDTRAALARLEPGALVAGIRFRPGFAPSLLGVPACALRDQRCDLALLWGTSATAALAERLKSAGDEPGAIMRVLETGLEARLTHATPPDPLIDGLVSRLRDPATGVRIGALARELGVTERQLLRRCEAAVGYSPKVLGRVLRVQRFLALARLTSWSLAELATAAGYSDQPHLTRDSRELTGLTPAALLADRGLRPRSSDP